MATEKQCTGGLFSVALSVADSPPRLRAPHEKAAPWRYQARRPLVPAQSAETCVPGTMREDYGVRTFLPASLLAKKGPAITRLARQRKYSIILSNAPGQRGHSGKPPETPALLETLRRLQVSHFFYLEGSVVRHDSGEFKVQKRFAQAQKDC
jgi:hypothetical protein